MSTVELPSLITSSPIQCYTLVCVCLLWELSDAPTLIKKKKKNVIHLCLHKGEPMFRNSDNHHGVWLLNRIHYILGPKAFSSVQYCNKTSEFDGSNGISCWILQRWGNQLMDPKGQKKSLSQSSTSLFPLTPNCPSGKMLRIHCPIWLKTWWDNIKVRAETPAKKN